MKFEKKKQEIQGNNDRKHRKLYIDKLWEREDGGETRRERVATREDGGEDVAREDGGEDVVREDGG